MVAAPLRTTVAPVSSWRLCAARRERDGADVHDPVAEAAAAVWVHGEAARLAARARHAPGQPIQARQIADAIPPVIGGILGG